MQLAFADWANLEGEFHPTYAEIAEKARVTKPGAIGIVQSMIEEGEIELLKRGRGRGSKNCYRFAEKYRDAVRDLAKRWSSKRAEKVNRADHFGVNEAKHSGLRTVNQDDHLKVNEGDRLRRERVAHVDLLKVNQDDHLKQQKVNEDKKKVNEDEKHVRNNPSCIPSEREQDSLPLPAIDELANTLCSLYQIPDSAGWRLRDKFQYLAIELNGVGATPAEVRAFYSSRVKKPGVEFFAGDFVTWRASQQGGASVANVQSSRPPVVVAPADWGKRQPREGMPDDARALLSKRRTP
ncbi:MAG TPA: hypothetical protein VFV58_06975 [Blastocatellia bacterium]|nr:hypothetical protein [Blastocatellia bacterium]